MTGLSEYNAFGEEIEKLLLLRTAPLAVKMLETEQDIPEGAMRPKKDRGIHIAQCQAFALSRRDRISIAMLKEDSWCPAPISAYGMVEPREGYAGSPIMIESPEAADKLAGTSPEFETGKYVGVVSAPLKTANFEPDLVLIYSNVAQLRAVLMAAKYKSGTLLTPVLDPLRSCVFSIIPPLLTGECQVTIPDAGEHLRTMVGEDEIIYSMPAGMTEELVLGLRHFDGIRFGYTKLGYDLRPDFPQPEHYQKMFRQWGLDA